MNWKRWKLGMVVAIVLSFIVAGSGVAAGMHWQAFISVLCTALLTHMGAFLKDHPIEQVSFDTETKSNALGGAPPGVPVIPPK